MGKGTETMDYKDVLREKQHKLEDAFIDRAEKAINEGKDFDAEFQSGWDINYRLSPEWRTRYEEMQQKAAKYRMYHQTWSADGIRKEIADLRQAKLQSEMDEKFYQSNRNEFVSAIENGKPFREMGLSDDMKPLFQRAQKEVLGYIPDEEPEPAFDPFIMGFMA